MIPPANSDDLYFVDAGADQELVPPSWRQTVLPTLFTSSSESANGFSIPASRPSIRHLFDLARDNADFLRIAAPMVRYSKLPFRAVARHFGTDVCYTPMIMADVFKERRIARDVELEVNDGDRPLVVQFAANTAEDLVGASEFIARHVDGIDINCGCPQKWAIQDGLGCALLEKPDLVSDMVRQFKSRIPSTTPISIKIRLHPDIRQTVELARRAEHVGVEWVTVHGRTRRQRNTEDPNMEGVGVVTSCLSIPCVANGSINSLFAARAVARATGCLGAMSARGLLANPAMFDDRNFKTTPPEAVDMFIGNVMKWGMVPRVAAQQVAWMMEGVMTRQERRTFNALTTMPAIIDYMEEHYGMVIGRDDELTKRRG
ncbi:tRNA-dihydrouridine(20a/20b) synthase [NAD(P)+]-like protein [Gonapodya sp. JEL0774]|nr:tRNA-dihydrouridine(20a/20b) synthase [NAD(P)+]-like protein [Gonapodya sp. JEL0774]